MAIVNIACSECGSEIGLREEDLGHRVRCPLCQSVIFASEPASRSPDRPAGGFASEPPHTEVPFAESLTLAEAASEEAPHDSESIFGPPDESSDDVLAISRRPLPDIPPVEALNPPGAHALAPDLPPLEPGLDQHRGAGHFLDQPDAKALSDQAATGVLEDHPHGEMPHHPSEAGDSASLPAPANVVRHRSTPSVLVPILLTTLIPYSIFATGLIIYLLYQQHNLNRDPTIHFLEKMLDESNKKGQEIKRVQHDAPLPAHLRTPLHTSLAVGAIEVEALKVVLNAQKDSLMLYLRLKNVSSPDNGGNLEFNPLPERYAEVDKNKEIKPYIFLEAGEHRLYGGRVQYLSKEGKKGARQILGPAQEMTVMLITRPDDRTLIPLVLESKSSLLWRVQLRRGLEKLYGSDHVVTCVIGIEFSRTDIQSPAL